MSGTLFVVATPIGNLEDITIRALRILREVAVIAAEDTRRTQHLLARYAIATPMTSLHAHNEAHKSSVLLGRLAQGDHVAIVSDAGTPTLSDPGGRLIRAAIAAGVRVEPVPGPSAALAALVASGLGSDSVTFLGFPPTKPADHQRWLTKLANVPGVAVFFEAPHRIVRTLNDLLNTVGDRQVVVGREMTKIHEQFLRGRISEVLPLLASPIGEFTIVVEIGHTTDDLPALAVRPEQMAHEFGLMTEHAGLTRRQAIGKLARKYGVGANSIYEAIEQAKNSGL